ncbi:hypothetical protein ACFOGG_15440 [Brenneria rubrifaciens]
MSTAVKPPVLIADCGHHPLSETLEVRLPEGNASPKKLGALSSL